MGEYLIYNGEYIETIEDFKNLLKGRLTSNLKADIATDLKHGVIYNWLNDGESKEYKQRAEKVKQLKFDSASDDSMINALKTAFDIKPDSDTHTSFRVFLELQSISYLTEANSENLSNLTQKIFLNPKQEFTLSIEFRFRVKEIGNQKFHIKLIIEDKHDERLIVYDATKEIFLNVYSKKSIPTVTFSNISLTQWNGIYKTKLIVCHEEQIWIGQISYTKEPQKKKEEIPINNGITFNMIFVPGNESISPFYIGETVVTLDMFKALNYGKTKIFNERKPFTNERYDEVQRLILDKLKEKTMCSFRLPTEAEWFHAARGGKSPEEYHEKYVGSGQIDTIAWYKSNSKGKTHDVKRKSENSLGLYDMNGNVWEMLDGGEYFCGGCCLDGANKLDLRNCKSKYKKYEQDYYPYDEIHVWGVRLVCDVEEMARWLSMQQNNDDTEPKDLKDERARLVQQYNQMKQNDQTYENNLGFLSVSSKKGDLLIDEMKHKMQKNKEDMELVKERIRVIDEESKCHGSHIYFSASSPVANLPKTQSSIEEEMQENIEPEPSVSQTIEEIYPTLRKTIDGIKKTKETIGDSYRDAFRKALHSVPDEAQGNDSTLDSKIELAAQHYRENNGLSSIVSSLKTHKDSQDSYQDNDKYHNKARRIITKCCSRDNVSESMNFTQSGLSFVKLLEKLERHGVYLTKSGVVRCCSTIGDVEKLIAQELYFAESK